MCIYVMREGVASGGQHRIKVSIIISQLLYLYMFYITRHFSFRPLLGWRVDWVGGSEGPSLQAAFHGHLLQGEPGPVSAAASR